MTQSMPPLLQPAPGADLWVFGYGSLIWDPGFPHLEVRRGRLYGFHRRFCIYSHVWRGTPERPGLVLGLDRGGSCAGLLFRAPAAETRDVLTYLYERELVTNVYIPRWLTVASAEGPVRAAGFVVDRDHHQYAGRLDLATTIEHVLQGRGLGGACVDYLANTVHHLEALGLSDGALKRLHAIVEGRSQPLAMSAAPQAGSSARKPQP